MAQPSFQITIASVALMFCTAPCQAAIATVAFQVTANVVNECSLSLHMYDVLPSRVQRHCNAAYAITVDPVIAASRMATNRADTTTTIVF